MQLSKDQREYWETYQKAIGQDVSALFYEAFHFDDNKEDANALVQLVLAGTKRATAGLLWSHEAEQKPLPRPGVLSIVTNWNSEPLCIIETTKVAVVPFGSVSEEFAATEGEGDKTLEYWRKAHWSYFGRECVRIGREPSLHMPVVCEQFRVVYPEVT